MARGLVCDTAEEVQAFVAMNPNDNAEAALTAINSQSTHRRNEVVDQLGCAVVVKAANGRHVFDGCSTSRVRLL